VKLPAIFIALPLAYLAVTVHGTSFIRMPALWVWSALVLALSLAWYVHAYTVSLAHFPHHMFGEGGLQVVDLGSFLDIAKRVATDGVTPIVAVAALVGLFVPFRGRGGGVFHVWLIALALFTVVAGRGSRHEWYQLPLVPVAAALAGCACDVGLERVRSRDHLRLAPVLAGLYLALVAVLAAFSVHPLYEPWAAPLREAGRELDRIAPPAALVVFTEWDPTTVYYSRRKGWRLEREGRPWALPRDTDETIQALDLFRAQGARYLVFTRHSRWWFDEYPGFREHLDSRYPRVRHTDDYTIFDLRGPGPSRTAQSRQERDVGGTRLHDA